MYLFLSSRVLSRGRNCTKLLPLGVQPGGEGFADTSEKLYQISVSNFRWEYRQQLKPSTNSLNSLSKIRIFQENSRSAPVGTPYEKGTFS